jgi:hypothetical protein
MEGIRTPNEQMTELNAQGKEAWKRIDELLANEKPNKNDYEELERLSLEVKNIAERLHVLTGNLARF